MMEQFRQWEKHDCINRSCQFNDANCRKCENLRKNAWRAALRWAKAMHDVTSEPGFNVNIRKELGDT